MTDIYIIIQIALSVAGTIIGAGFATGKELLVFFDGNSSFSVILLFCSLILMGTVSLLYLRLLKRNIENKILTFIFMAFSCGCYAIMIACGGQTIFDTLNIDYRIGIIITYIITVIIIKFGINGVYKFNTIATPIIIIALLAISFAGMSKTVFLSYTMPYTSALLYSGYNILSILPFTGAVFKESGYEKTFWGISVGFAVVIIVSIALKTLLNNYYFMIASESIPILKIVSLINPFLSYIYGIVLYAAILTTAVSSLYVLTKGKNIFLASSPLVALSFLGFTALLEKIYTYFGYVGIIIIITLGVSSLYGKGKQKKLGSKHNFRKS